MRTMFRHFRLHRTAMLAVLCVLVTHGSSVLAADGADELEIALSLANTLRAARTEVSRRQDLINDAETADKGLSGTVVVEATIERVKSNGNDLAALDATSKHGRLIKALLAAIAEVMDEHQGQINAKGVGFKGFVPAVFARLVNERFGEKVGAEAALKVTAPTDLVRNRKARPDAWERNVIDTKFKSDDWRRGKLFSEMAAVKERPAFRVLVPEYYGAGCLVCHGDPRGEVDITGYPKEGGTLGTLGGAISITLFQ